MWSGEERERLGGAEVGTANWLGLGVVMEVGGGLETEVAGLGVAVLGLAGFWVTAQGVRGLGVEGLG